MPETEVADHAALQLVEAMTARMCHDLAAPVGTVTGLLELSREDPRMAEEALAEAAEAALATVRRLRLFRAAWGGVGGPMSVQELAACCDGLPGHRLHVDLDGLSTAMFQPMAARLVLNVLLLGASSLRRGGRVALSGDPATQVIASIDGPGAAWPAGLAARLVGVAGGPGPIGDGRQELELAMVSLIARQSGLRVSLLMAAADDAAPPLLLDLTQS